jgi:4-amino-4-deoxy-L-arabinose transferase-like glycosyltransferase
MMTNAHPSEPHNRKEMSRDILLLAIWSLVLFLCALTLKNYYLNGQPPLWDNLDYQKQSLHILTQWLDGDSEKALKSLYVEKFPAYLFTIASSFLLFGFNPVSPYIASAFFGTGCMIAIYLLSRELGADKRVAFWGVIAFSLLPNFIYQNFLQTRNDFPAAFFIAFSWIFLLRGIKNKDLRLAFLAGVLAGVGTLFKASTAGYVAWGILAFLALPEKYTKANIKDRMYLSLLFVGGAVLACGWHFLPNLGKVFAYYKAWGAGASALQAIQYNLQLDWTDYLFYPKNLIQVQLGEKTALGLALVIGVLGVRWIVLRQSKKVTENNSNEWNFLILIFCASFLAVAFVSFRRVFASIGDIPVLPLLAAGSIALTSRISIGVVIPRFFLFAVLPIGLVVSLSNLNIAEKQFSAKDIETFSHETLNIRKELGLGNTPMMQVFSHPIYNIRSLAWSWLINPKKNRRLIHKSTNNVEIIFPEEAETIASKINRFPLLIISDVSGTIIQGEKFTTVNRLHAKINSAIEKQDQFIKLRSVNLEDGRFPIHFMLNKNYSVLRPMQVTVDNWVEWKGEVQYFASRPAKLIWRGIPIRKMDSFQLVDRDNPASSITMQRNQAIPDGGYEYQSKTILPTKKLRTFIVTPESPNHLLPASNIDKRMLAFYRVETKVIIND